MLAPNETYFVMQVPELERLGYDLADNACHVIIQNLDPRFLSLAASLDVVSVICRP